MSKNTKAGYDGQIARATEGIRDRLGRLSELNGELEANVGALIDDGGDRPALIARREGLLAEQDALVAEVAELKARRSAAERMKAQDAYAAAQAEAQEAQAKALTCRRALDVALNAMRQWRNTEGRGSYAEGAAKESAHLEHVIVDARTASVQASARARQAGARRDDAAQALADVEAAG